MLRHHHFESVEGRFCWRDCALEVFWKQAGLGLMVDTASFIPVYIVAFVVDLDFYNQLPLRAFD